MQESRRLGAILVIFESYTTIETCIKVQHHFVHNFLNNYCWALKFGQNMENVLLFQKLNFDQNDLQLSCTHPTICVLNVIAIMIIPNNNQVKLNSESQCRYHSR